MVIPGFPHAVRGKTLAVRCPEEKDAESMIRHVNLICGETDFLGRDAGTFDIPPEKERELIASWRESPNTLFLIAADGDETVATCSLQGSSKSRFCHAAGFAIGIQRAYWGGGLGEALMRASIGWAKEQGLRRLTLKCSAENLRAIRLYMKLGFRVEGRHVGEMRQPDGRLDDGYSMALLLD